MKVYPACLEQLVKQLSSDDINCIMKILSKNICKKYVGGSYIDPDKHSPLLARDYLPVQTRLQYRVSNLRCRYWGSFTVPVATFFKRSMPLFSLFCTEVTIGTGKRLLKRIPIMEVLLMRFALISHPPVVMVRSIASRCFRYLAKNSGKNLL